MCERKKVELSIVHQLINNYFMVAKVENCKKIVLDIFSPAFVTGLWDESGEFVDFFSKAHYRSTVS